jgi:hypothetical protein
LLLAIASWQLVAIAWVDVDYFDAYETLINARYFLGEAPSYIPSRWPMMAWLVAPAEALRQAWDLHPLDLRLVHAVSGALHLAFIAAVYSILARHFGRGGPTLLAYAAAIPTYAFFSSAAFLSSDIAPGGVLLWMLVLGHEFLIRPTRREWALLVVLGAAVSLVKPTYALFWPALLLGLASGSSSGVESSAHRARLGRLLAAASFSALLFWLGSAFALNASGVDVAWWREPYEQILHLLTMQEGDQPPWWVYLRNLPAYGILVPLLIAPAISVALRRGGLERAVAIAWLVCALAMQAFEHREVRYLAFLAPLSAFLLVRPMGWILARRGPTWAACGLLALSWLPGVPYSPLTAAGRIAAPFYRSSELRQLLAPLGHGEQRQKPVVLLGPGLSFTPADVSSPLRGDPFHMIFHFFPHQVTALLGYEEGEVLGSDPQQLEALQLLPLSAKLVFASGPLLRTYVAWPPPGRDSRQQWVAGVVEHELIAQRDGVYRTAAGDEVRLRHALGGEFAIRLEGAGLVSLAADMRTPWLLLPAVLKARAEAAQYRLAGDAARGYDILGMLELPQAQRAPRLRIRGLVLESGDWGGSQRPAAVESTARP